VAAIDAFLNETFSVGGTHRITIILHSNKMELLYDLIPDRIKAIQCHMVRKRTYDGLTLRI